MSSINVHRHSKVHVTLAWLGIALDPAYVPDISVRYLQSRIAAHCPSCSQRETRPHHIDNYLHGSHLLQQIMDNAIHDVKSLVEFEAVAAGQ